ncbi:MAG: Mov34/MPN/PAD-1 family protein [Gemmataceae bacterium]|nr:Mov34/MPN/PAD-1 family protein [Gemmataceae bacterium]
MVLTDEVSRTLFEEYAAHRATDRGKEETGWVLLGLRLADEAVVLATLPAAADRDAGEAHVWITGPAHLLASRIVRQCDRRLTMLGVVHTHPGSLRHPSKGDFRGDREWVPQLRGGEGVFGIGTADAPTDGASPPGGPDPAAVGSHPRPHVQTLGGLRFSWYTLAAGDRKYREVPVELTIGPDLARPLRLVWPAVEAHAGRLDRLARQLSRVGFELAATPTGAALVVVVGLGEPGHVLRVSVDGEDVRYVCVTGEESREVKVPAVPIDRGVFLALAELAAEG